ncbi:MAG: phosphopantetheine-binding protein [Clostridiales bacterium]|jgi:acyl carrier protein|nr:phosphopantetheine-binding protein [Clostridiales bacterium]
MGIPDRILRMLEEKKRSGCPVKPQSELYKDLSFDSLSFIALLLEIEEIYSIVFEIAEMEKCLRVVGLIAATERKVREKAP